MFNPSRDQVRQFFCEAWRKHRAREILDGAEAIAADLITHHPEYHKLYADLQVDLTGSEGWGYTNLPGAEIGEFTGDCGFQDSASVVTGALGEGRFVLFFPEELHKPGLVQHGCVSVRKAVVKIRMEE